MRRFLKNYALSIPLFLVIDLAWIALMTPRYIEQYGAAIRGTADGFKPLLWAAIVAYALIPLGAVLFSRPHEGTLKQVACRGAAFGAIVYGIHDFTNLATINDWGVTMTIVDTIWGGVLCGSIAAILFAFNKQKNV